MESLPKDVLEHIFATLSARDLLQASCTRIASRCYTQRRRRDPKTRNILQGPVRLGGRPCGRMKIGGIAGSTAGGLSMRRLCRKQLQAVAGMCFQSVGSKRVSLTACTFPGGTRLSKLRLCITTLRDRYSVQPHILFCSLTCKSDIFVQSSRCSQGPFRISPVTD